MPSFFLAEGLWLEGKSSSELSTKSSTTSSSMAFSFCCFFLFLFVSVGCFILKAKHPQTEVQQKKLVPMPLSG